MAAFGNRREFMKTTAAAGLGLSVSGSLPAIHKGISPNEKVVVAVMGVKGRGGGLANTFASLPGSEVAVICDVDENVIGECIKDVTDRQDKKPEAATDIRKVLERDDIDAIVIAAPDHWHAPAALMAMQAGKHVYLEKPCSHNPREGELLIQAQKKYNKVVQMGTQQRSGPRSIELVEAIHDGIIGDAYFAKAFYSNTRGSIGRGKTAPVPAGLDYDLWQGPAPRVDFKDNIIHYNWHWFWHWGTGEACNNGTHEVDVCRWALDVDYPSRVMSTGGRYHFDDDWEFYDTQIMSFEFEGGKSISWEGRSCNGHQFFGRGRGSTIHGTNGTALVDRDGYIIFDHKGKEIKRNMKSEATDQLNTIGTGDLTDYHIDNFCKGIRDGAKLNTPIDEGHKSVLLCHLGNIAQHTGQVLECNPENGHVYDKDVMEKMWGRTYEPGWEMKV
ncbi:MAG: Gfo/Idh/MocA family protein [Rhodothermales bacterium]